MLASWPKGNVAQGCSWVCQGKGGYGYWRLPLLLTLFASCPPTLSRSVTGPALHAQARFCRADCCCHNCETTRRQNSCSGEHDSAFRVGRARRYVRPLVLPRTFAQTRTHEHTHTEPRTHACMHACMHARTHTKARACVCMCVFVCARARTHTNAHTHTHIHTHARAHTCPDP